MNKSRFPRIFERIYDRPMMLLPAKAFEIERVFQTAIAGMSTEGLVREAFRDDGSAAAAPAAYRVTRGGVAILPVMGTLVQRSSFMDAYSGITSYAEIGFAFAQAEADPKVGGILLEIDSNGGEVNGCFDLVDQIAASTKPVWAVANEAAYSAAYAIASAADRLFMPRTAGVGSIGVLTLHVDESERDKKQGYTYTPIFAGDHKVDGNSHEPLPDDVKQAIQDDIDRVYGLFVSTVAQNRAVPSESVVDTQADVYHPEAAIQRGLADDIGTLDDAVALFEQSLAEPTTAAPRMPARFKPAATSASTGVLPIMDPITTPEQLAAATAEASRTAATAATGAERTRVAAILTSAEAEGRTDMANHLALETNMSAEDAIKLLAKSPKAAPPAPAAPASAGSEFATAMAVVGNPNVAADVDPAQKTESEIEEATMKQIAAFAGKKPATA